MIAYRPLPPEIFSGVLPLDRRDRLLPEARDQKEFPRWIRAESDPKKTWWFPGKFAT
jgi:hypothetical protein